MAQSSCSAPFSLCLPRLALSSWPAAAKWGQPSLPSIAADDGNQRAARTIIRRWPKVKSVQHSKVQAAETPSSEMTSRGEVGVADSLPSCEDQWAAMCRAKAQETAPCSEEVACCSSSADSPDHSTECGSWDNCDSETQSVSKAVLTPGRSIEESSQPDGAMREVALSEAFAGPSAEVEVEIASSGTYRRLAGPWEELMADVENKGTEFVEHILHDARGEDCRDFDECLVAAQQLDRIKAALGDDMQSEKQKEGGEIAVGGPLAGSSFAADSSAYSDPADSIWARLVAPWQELLEDSAFALGIIHETANSGANRTDEE